MCSFVEQTSVKFSRGVRWEAIRLPQGTRGAEVARGSRVEAADLLKRRYDRVDGKLPGGVVKVS